MANRDPIQTAKNFYEKGFMQGNLPYILGLLTDDIQWWVFGPPGFACNGFFPGKAAVQQFFVSLQASLGDTHTTFHPAEYYASDVPGQPKMAVVTVFGLETGTIRQWGPSVDQPFFNYWSHSLYIVGGKISRFRANFTVIPPNAVPSPLLGPVNAS
jgi:hypothetical protein